MRYIHEHPDWPTFRWSDAELASVLARVRHTQGRLLGRMDGLGLDLRLEASVTTLTADAVKSSAIEGEVIDAERVRSSIAHQLGLEIGEAATLDRDAEGVVTVLLDATQNYRALLTAERLGRWHAALFPNGLSGARRITVGAWRKDELGPMRVVSGHQQQRVHFEAPSAALLDGEMARFLAWFEDQSQLDPVLHAAIAHLWFVTVHPFDDGNGRIARAIADMALARGDQTSSRFYSMSSQIEREKRAYYDQLERQQRGTLDITPWLGWFCGCLERSIIDAETTLNSVLNRARFWDRLNQGPINERQRAVITRMLGAFQGFLTSSKYAAFAKCSPDTAQRDISELVARGVLIRNQGGGRSTSYRLGSADDVR